MKKIIVNIVRWLLVLPCAIMCLWLFYSFLVPSAIYIPIPYIDYIIEFISGVFGSAIFVLAGSYIAPCFKRKTAYVLLALMAAYSVYAIVDPYKLYEDVGLIEAIIYKFGGLVGAFFAAVTTDD